MPIDKNTFNSLEWCPIAAELSEELLVEFARQIEANPDARPLDQVTTVISIMVQTILQTMDCSEAHLIIGWVVGEAYERWYPGWRAELDNKESVSDGDTIH